MESVASLFVPQWYRDAKARGESEDALKLRIVEFCLESAARRGMSPPDLPDAAVTLTYNAYEYALRREET